MKSYFHKKFPLTIIAVLAAVLITMIALAQYHPAVSYYHPQGYLRKVKTLMETGALTYNQSMKKIQFNADGKAPSQFIDFYRSSYLKNDVESFNSGKGKGIFYVQEGALKIDECARNIDFELFSGRHWKGTLSFRKTHEGILLENDHTTIQLLRPSTGQLPLKAADYTTLQLRGLRGTHSAQAFCLADGDLNRHFMRLEYIGDDVVLEICRDNPMVAVNGHKIPLGHRVRLEDGDMLLFYESDRMGGTRVVDILVFKAHSLSGMLSTSRTVNGRFGRLNTPGLLPMAVQLSNGTDAVVRAQPTSDDETRNFDVVLTVDQQLHERLQIYLEHFIAEHSGGLSPAAITLMDIQTGDLLALASYPDPSQVPEGHERLAFNQNLLLHPIGSAGKPFEAAAIWDVFPGLAELRTGWPHSSPIEETLGIGMILSFPETLHSELYMGRNPYPVDRRAFLKYSSNLYMANLFLLALAADENGGISWTNRRLAHPNAAMGKDPIIFAPDLSQYLDGRRLIHLEDHKVIRKLAEAFDVDIAAHGAMDPDENTAAAYDPGPIDLLVHRLNIENLPTPLIYNVCPERVNLRFNQIHELRGDFISFLLGGASSQWTNVKLAEAMARIATGKRIHAHLIDEVLDHSGVVYSNRIGELPEVPLRKQTLAWVREGLELPATPGGTASQLAPDLARTRKELAAHGLALRWYSKTGTPNGHLAGQSSAVYVFCARVENASGALVAGISGAVFIADRGKSSLAVECARKVLGEIIDYLRREGRC